MVNRSRLINNNSAFSLIEIIIVIIIIGALASIAPVVITKYLSNQDIDIASARLVSSLEYLQKSATASNQSKIIINISSGSYSLNANDISETVYLPRNIFFQQAPAQITFNSKGISTTPAGDTIILTNLNKRNIITVKKITGEIELKKN